MEALKKVDSSPDLSNLSDYERHHSTIDIILGDNPHANLLHKYKHSVYVDYVDVGVKRGHHYMEKRMNDYKKALSDNCIAEEFAVAGLSPKEVTISKKRKSGQYMTGVWEDMNNNLLNSLLIPVFITNARAATSSAQVLGRLVTETSYKVGSTRQIKTAESSKCMIKVCDEEGVCYKQTISLET